ncbi:MAG: hypothetical protein MSIBF_06750 [Candidatus Altiarchaeales archaeon IMC4]|nr:MAG: hypothetical protein MSIBF_06750 [Candidatus Altiarchaeales archaeon IMC4]
MTKKKILITGEKVHNVGYRLFLMNSADDFRIENFDAKNIMSDGKQCVKVLVESSQENINRFLAFVENKENRPEHAKVDSIKPDDYDDYVKPLESFRSGFMAYQQQKFANAGVGLLNVQEGMLCEMKAFRKESNEKQDSMLEKQDSMLEKQDSMLEKQEQTINEIKNVGANVNNLRTETNENFQHLRTETQNLRTETNENFQHLDIKYGILAQNMNKIFEELVKERQEFKKSMQAERKESNKNIEKLVKAILKSKR